LHVHIAFQLFESNGAIKNQISVERTPYKWQFGEQGNNWERELKNAATHLVVKEENKQ